MPKKPYRRYTNRTKLEAQRIFVDGVGNLSDIARKLDVNYYTVRLWSHQGNWNKARDDRLIAEQTRINQSAGQIQPMPPPIEPSEDSKPLPHSHTTAYLLMRISEHIDTCPSSQADRLQKLIVCRGLLIDQQAKEQEPRSQGQPGPTIRTKGAVVQPIRRLPAPQDVVLDAESDAIPPEHEHETPANTG
jgi:hypothetical protein